LKNLLPIGLLLALVAALVLLFTYRPEQAQDPQNGGAARLVEPGQDPQKSPAADLALPPELSSSGRVFDEFYGEKQGPARSAAEVLKYVPEEAGLPPFDPDWNLWLADQIDSLDPFGVPGDRCRWPGFDGQRTIDHLGPAGAEDFPARARARADFWPLEYKLDDQRLRELDVAMFERNVKTLEDMQVLNNLGRAALRTIVTEGRGLWVPGPAEIAWQLRLPGAGDPDSPWVFSVPHRGWTFVARFEGPAADEMQQYKRLVERNEKRYEEFGRIIARGETPTYSRGG
jgi:hypothetical protein